MNATFDAVKTVLNASTSGMITNVFANQDGWEKIAIVGFNGTFFKF